MAKISYREANGRNLYVKQIILNRFRDELEDNPRNMENSHFILHSIPPEETYFPNRDIYHHKGATLVTTMCSLIKGSSEPYPTISLTAYGREEAIKEAVSDIERLTRLKFEEVMEE